jgi:hypothetical protein
MRLLPFQALRLPASLALLTVVALPAWRPADAQPSRTDYARAEQLLSWNAQELLVNDAVQARWMPGDRFWYRNRSPRGWEYLVVDMATGARRPAFDHAKLASALSVAADTTYDATKLPFRELVWVSGEKAIRFSVARNKNWTCDVTTYACTGPDTMPVEGADERRQRRLGLRSLEHRLLPAGHERPQQDGAASRRPLVARLEDARRHEVGPAWR